MNMAVASVQSLSYYILIHGTSNAECKIRLLDPLPALDIACKLFLRLSVSVFFVYCIHSFECATNCHGYATN